VTNTSQAFSLSFSTTHSSRLYRFLFSFTPGSGQRNGALAQCLSNGRISLLEDGSDQRVVDFGRDVSFSSNREKRVFSLAMSDVVLSSGVEYTFEASLPEFGPECNSLQPVLILAIGPSPSL